MVNGASHCCAQPPLKSYWGPRCEARLSQVTLHNMPASFTGMAPTAASWTGQHQARFDRQACISNALLAGPSWLRRPAQPHHARLPRPAAASTGRQGSTPKGPTQPPAEALLLSQQPDHWEQARQRVVAFQQQHGRLPRANGDASIPLVPGERSLGLWCSEQQRRKAGSKGLPLTAQEEEALAAILGWAWWRWQRVRVSWEQRLEQLEAFARQHGRLPRQAAAHANPLLPGEQELGRWLNGQRSRFKGQAQPQLSTEQIAALERVPGWTWGLWVQQPWEEWYQQVAAFVQQHGRLPREAPSKLKPLLPDERELAQWCKKQRQRWKGNRRCSPPLAVEQQVALEALPGWFWENVRTWEVPCEEDQWEQACQRVIAFQQQHGRLPRAIGDASCPLVPGERPLGLWCAEQQRCKAGSKGLPLTGQELAALAAVPGWAWWPSQRVRVGWEQRLEQLKAFARQQGRLPRQASGIARPLVPGERELGAWLSTQRNRYKGQVRPQLSTEQVAALEAVPGWTWGLFVHQPWEEWYQQVEAFLQQHGRLPRKVPSKSKPLLPREQELAQWCSIRRQRWKGNRRPALTVEQQEALENLPGWWWEKVLP